MRRNHNLQISAEPFTPAADAHTYRDLLIFEERLKQNAARLLARKKKYETLLAAFMGFIAFLAYHVLVDPKKWIPLHYLNVALLLISCTTLFLFFASGMYSERIRSANKFVPQANRSLRSFNMYLNTRTIPRSSLLSFFSPNRSRQALSDPASSSNYLKSRSTAAQATAQRRAAISRIPSSTNPRGELIFSTKVSPAFREGYERYRAAFERRRAEKLEAKRRKGWRKWFEWLGLSTKVIPNLAAEVGEGRISSRRPSQIAVLRTLKSSEPSQRHQRETEDETIIKSGIDQKTRGKEAVASFSGHQVQPRIGSAMAKHADQGDSGTCPMIPGDLRPTVAAEGDSLGISDEEAVEQAVGPVPSRDRVSRSSVADKERCSNRAHASKVACSGATDSVATLQRDLAAKSFADVAERGWIEVRRSGSYRSRRIPYSEDPKALG
ncbi:hypothetical protein IE53DRAFT_86469 [Violaceomyces palustris]|uniref:Uncharacterized protein n=1 Tax=Violaceomyces palustris TaxID=1673888 RepID=A0ACD0NXP8_9BASI|nr:hypothetical protein IE53DRAFT_86469 [Violaceomyces palustris]